MFICARLSTWNTPSESPFAQHRIDRRIFARDARQRLDGARGAAPSRSRHLRMQVSMPSASTSILRMPSASMSSLSHSMKLRSGIAPLPIGTVSISGPWVRMKPPTCCDRWRGMPIICSVSLRTRAQLRVAEIEPGLAGVLLGDLAAVRSPDGARQRRR